MVHDVAGDLIAAEPVELAEAELELVAGGLRAEWMDNKAQNNGG